MNYICKTQIYDHFYGSVWPTGYDTSVMMQNF